MNKKPQAKAGNDSLKKAAIYCLIVGLLIILSIAVRIIFLIKDSNYDGKNRYTLSIITSSRDALILSINPALKTISKINITGNRLGLSPAKLVGVPADGRVILRNNTITYKDTSPDQILYKLLLTGNLEKKDVTTLDLLRLFIFSKTIPRNDINEENINFPAEWTAIDNIAANSFTDDEIAGEKISIEIINGTAIDGLGKRLERILNNIGCNVVAVTNSRDIIDKSAIYYYSDISYTQMKLQRILNYPSKFMQNRDIADIKIVIGKDGLRNDIF